MLGSLSISITVKFLSARRLPLLFEPKIKKSPAENHQCVFFLSADVAHRSLRQSSLDLTNPRISGFELSDVRKHQLS